MKKLFYIATFTVSAWLIGFLIFNHYINSFAYDDSSTQAIIALTGGRNRIIEATKLLNDGKADKMFISGVAKKASLKAIQKRNGLATENSREIALGKKATNTIENAIETKAWLEQNHVQSIRLVTSNYHLPRSIMEFKAQNPDLKIIAHPVYSEKVYKNWWQSWHSFALIFSEYNKFLCVFVRTHLHL